MLNTEVQRTHKNYTKKYIDQLFVLIDQLKLKDDEELYFKNSVQSNSWTLQEGEVNNIYCGITKTYIITEDTYIGGKEYVNIKANYIHTPTLRAIINQVKILLKER